MRAEVKDLRGLFKRRPAHVIGDEAEALRVAEALAREFGKGACRRDTERLLPFAELDEFSRSGLWGITVPRAHGGADFSYKTVAKIIETISAADPSIGQIPQNHFANVFLIRALGTPAQQARYFRLILAGARLGNALAEMSDKAVHAFETRVQRCGAEGYRLNGRKFYSTGALFADFIPVGALDEAGQRLTVIVPRHAAGVTVIDDWASFGQRTTASGTVLLEDVFVPEDDVLPYYRTFEDWIPNGPVSQIIHAAIDSGIALAAIEDTKRLIRETARPWRDSGSTRAADDVYTIEAIARLEIRLHAAQAMLDRAGGFVDRAIAAPDARTVAEASIAVAEAKVLTSEISLEAGTALFEFAGTRATLAPQRYDRHWRNARVHTLHDPVRWKYNIIGDWSLNGKQPPRHGLV